MTGFTTAGKRALGSDPVPSPHEINNFDGANSWTT